MCVSIYNIAEKQKVCLDGGKKITSMMEENIMSLISSFGSQNETVSWIIHIKNEDCRNTLNHHPGHQAHPQMCSAHMDSAVLLVDRYQWELVIMKNTY